MNLLVFYFVAVNIFAVIITVFDKVRAIRHKGRVSEFTLMLISAVGGSAAMYLTMLIIRHKSRHTKFMLGIPVIMLIQAALIYFIWRLLYA